MINCKCLVKSRLFCILLTFSFLVICFSTVAAQTMEDKEDKVLPPSEEEFQKASDLVGPWRQSGCLYSIDIDTFYWSVAYPDCVHVSGQQSAATHFLTIYNADQSVWYGFSIDWQKPDFFKKKPKKDFLPVATSIREYFDFVVLRMTGESKHWYEVEVNEQTRDVKYILKSDPAWAKSNWEYWLFKGTGRPYSNYLLVDGKREMLRDKPDGKIIEKPGDFDVDKLYFVKADGDWAYVKMPGNSLRGWIRWRNGREFLVGCIFNGFKIPAIEPGDGNASLSEFRQQTGPQ